MENLSSFFVLMMNDVIITYILFCFLISNRPFQAVRRSVCTDYVLDDLTCDVYDAALVWVLPEVANICFM